MVDYGLVENYLLRYCGINLGSTFTYLKMFRDCAHRSLDMTSVLDLPHTMMDVRGLFARCRVRYEDCWYCPPNGHHEKGTNYLMLVADPQDPKGLGSVGTVWVHVVQALLVAALMGPVELHADNSVALGKGIFQLIASRTLPQQAIPTTTLLCETFTYKYGEVVGEYADIVTKREYFWRPRVCYGAWRQGSVRDLNCVIGAHPMEDVIHIHAWVQLHLMHVGKLPAQFYHMPGGVPRGAELVPGRIYPVLGSKGGVGTVCVCPGGRAFVLVHMDGFRPRALHLETWQNYMHCMGMQLAPLIFRSNAAIRNDDGTLAALLKRKVPSPLDIDDMEDNFKTIIHCDVGPDNFLDWSGNYMSSSDDEPIPWRDAHSRLVKLGAHVVVDRDVVKEALKGEARMPQGRYTHVEGWLRYRECCDEASEDPSALYVAFRVSAQPNECEDVWVAPFAAAHCKLNADEPDAQCIDGLGCP